MSSHPQPAIQESGIESHRRTTDTFTGRSRWACPPSPWRCRTSASGSWPVGPQPGCRRRLDVAVQAMNLKETHLKQNFNSLLLYQLKFTHFFLTIFENRAPFKPWVQNTLKLALPPSPRPRGPSSTLRQLVYSPDSRLDGDVLTRCGVRRRHLAVYRYAM